MKLAKLKAVGIAAGVAALSFITTPASAGAVTISDVMPYWDVTVGDGVDYDAACQVDTSSNPPPPNYIKSTGAGASAGCPGITAYDGSTETTDFNGVTLSTNGVSSGAHSNTQLVATFNVDGPIPAAGPGSAAAADLPNATFVGFGYRAMYQNTTRQTNTPYVAATRLTGTPIYGLNEHWGDGFHFYVGFSANFTGAGWTHSAEIGVYDSGPDGAFFFTELGVSTSAGVWSNADPCMQFGTNWNVTIDHTNNKVSVTVDGTTRFSNVQAVGGCIRDEKVKAGDNIVNVKGLATADSTVVLPVTIPLSLIPGESDLTSVGGFLFFSDFTLGNSRNIGLNATLATETGDDPPTAPPTPCHNEGQGGIRLCQPYTSGAVGMFDTLGDGPRCWTPTFGGLAPSNPLWVSNQPCYIDDDNIPGPTGNFDPGHRGVFLQEWWDTAFGFTA